jgi:hypothetical protein
LAKNLTVDGTTYEFPENRDSPGWGEDATAWAEAVTDVLGNVSGQGDILQSSAIINNNISSATNVTGFFLDPSVLRGAVCEVSIYRSTSTEEAVEVLSIFAGYKSVAGTWEFVQIGGGSSGVTLTITNAGQVQYVSSNMSGTSYTGTVKFRARALTQ